MFRRPEIHFTPGKGWTNDPNGLIYADGKYHLYAQHNPDEIVWGPMHWLHATSDDLLHWKEDGIALFPDELGTMFSGSAAQLKDGTIALMYTTHGECQQQCVAFTRDGLHCEKYEGNPVIANPGFVDFRDPKMFWNDKYGCWSCVLAAGDHLEFYRSDDLKQWTKTGEFGFDPVRFGDIYECPDCFRLSTPDGGEAWVLMASMILKKDTTGSWMRYCVGTFDGDTFHRTEEWPEPLGIEVGYEGYAGVTYFGTAERTYVAWMSAKSIPLPMKDYCGCMSLPRTLKLLKTKDGHRLAHWPVLPGYESKPVSGGVQLPDAAFVLDVEADAPFELKLCGEKEGDFLCVRLTEDNRIETERSVSGHFAQDARYNNNDYRCTSVARAREGKIQMKIVVDSWCVEIFADEGLYTNGLLAFAENGWKKLDVAGEAAVSMAVLR